MDDLDKGSTSNEHPASAYHMPGTELRAPACPGPGTGRAGQDVFRRPGLAMRCLAGAGPARAASLARSGLSAATGFLLVVAGLLALPLQAQAQTVQTLVSNTGQDRDNSNLSVGDSSKWMQAQGFTTGDNTDGYTLSSVEVFFNFGFASDDEVTVSIYGADASGNAESSLYVLNNPSSIPNARQINSFAAPGNATLAHGTNYFVVVEALAGAFFLAGTDFDDEDSGNASGWSIDDTRRVNSQTATDWSEWEEALLIAVKGTVNGGTTTTDTPVTIEAEHESIGAGLEDLLFTLTREGETTEALDVTVTITQAQTWLGNLEYTVTFPADNDTATLPIGRSNFSFTPSTTGNLTATVSGDGIDGGSDTVQIISTSEAPITISYDMPEYTFAEDATGEAVYMVATLNAAYPRPPSFTFDAASFSSRGDTATSPEDYVAISDHRRFSADDFERDDDTDPFVARALIQDFIVPDDIYEGAERFVLWIEAAPGVSADLVQFAYPNGTTCAPINCSPTPEYEVTITDEGDLPVLSLSVDPSSIAEEDDDGTTGTAENVSTVTVEITNGKTFAEDQTVSLTFSGTATQGTHYSVNPGDADANTAGHQVVLVKETASVEVTVTATGNDTDDGPRTVTVAADLDGAAIGSRGITILDDDTTTPTTVPGAPTSLTATASGTTTINLSWTAPADNGGSPITGYRIEVSPNGTSSWTNRVADTGTTTTTYAHTGLSAGTTRHYRVSAINATGTGAASNTDNATTDDAATTVPGAPTSLTATASGTTTINLSWTAPADNGGSAITGYRIEVSPNGTSSWSNRVADTGTTTTTYAHTGLSAGTTRHYRVSAINATGTGAASSTDNATTGTTTDTGPLTLTVEAVEDTVTEGEPVRYRIRMSRRTPVAVVQSSFRYKGNFVRNPNSVVTSGINSHGGRLSWVVSYDTLDDVVDEPNGKFTVTIGKPDRTLTGGADLYSHGEEYTVGSPSSATVTILDNDGAGAPPPPSPPIVSAKDARVEEGPGAELVFPVTLDRAPVETARIDWQTIDGANRTGATAGQDYVAASGTLEFRPGQTSKTIRVAVLDDSHDEGNEVMLLYLTGAEHAVIDDALLKGTIENSDPLPRALMGRFGRTAALHVVERVEARMAAPRTVGVEGRGGRVDGPGRRDGPAREWRAGPGGGADGREGQPGRRAVRPRPGVAGTGRRASAHRLVRRGDPRDPPRRPPLVLEPGGAVVVRRPRGGAEARRRRAHDDGRGRLRDGAADRGGVAGPQPRPGRLHGRRHRRGALVGDRAVPVAGLHGV